jgi:hypothetical protein
VSEPKLLSREDLEWARAESESDVSYNPATDKTITTRDLLAHIAALEQQLEASMSPPSALVELQIVKVELEFALADNAVLLKAVNGVLDYVHCHTADMGGNHRYNLSQGHGPKVAMLRHIATQPHPGAALLEEHRKALVRARNEGLDAAIAAIDAAFMEDEDVAPQDVIRAMKEPES